MASGGQDGCLRVWRILDTTCVAEYKLVLAGSRAIATPALRELGRCAAAAARPQESPVTRLCFHPKRPQHILVSLATREPVLLTFPETTGAAGAAGEAQPVCASLGVAKLPREDDKKDGRRAEDETEDAAAAPVEGPAPPEAGPSARAALGDACAHIFRAAPQTRRRPGSLIRMRRSLRPAAPSSCACMETAGAVCERARAGAFMDPLVPQSCNVPRGV
jgi:hypothetical protein